MNDQPIGTATIILNENNQVLLGLRKNSARTRYWGLPGGRLNFKEKVASCASRELKEETGLVSKNSRLICVVKEWLEKNKQDFVHFIYLSKEWGGSLRLMEANKCEGWEWFDLDDLPTKILPSHLIGINQVKSSTNITFFDI